MKQMILFKWIDIIAQLLALIIPAGIAADKCDGSYLIIAYFSVGTWQVLSYLSNYYAANKQFHSKARHNYDTAIKFVVYAALVAIALCFTPAANIAMFYLVAMLFVGPIMAIYYFILSTLELRKLIVANTKLNNQL